MLIALTSNVDTGAVPSLARHQIRTLLAVGVRVTLNTDPPVSRTTLSWELAAEAAGLTPDDCRTMTAQAARAAFRCPVRAGLGPAPGTGEAAGTSRRRTHRE